MISRIAFIASLFALIFGGVLRPVGLGQRATFGDREEEEGGAGEDGAEKTPEQARKLAEEGAKLPTRHAAHLAHGPGVAVLPRLTVRPLPPEDHAPPDVHKSPQRLLC